MNIDTAVDLGQQAIVLSLLLATPVMGAAIVVGLSVSIFQTITQIQEQSLGSILKMIAMVAVLFLLMPWLLSQLIDFTTEVYRGIPISL